VDASYVETFIGSFQEKELLMKSIVNSVRRLVKDEQGMETVEWGVMAALIVVGLVAAIGVLGNQVLNKFNGLVDATK
jgi:Flp pilus assembly pilin Flp